MKKPKSLSANIANLLNSLPQGFEVDDELDDTNAKVLTADSDDSDQGEINERSKIRTQNIDLLESVDEKYAGKITNRKNCRDSESDFELEDEQNGEISHEENSSDESEKYVSDEEVSDEHDSDERNGDESEIEEETDISEGSGIDDDENFKHFAKSAPKEGTDQGQSVRMQLNVWENFLEMRIKSKKALSSCNKMPVGEKFRKIVSHLDNDSKDKLIQTNKNVLNLLEKMVTLQTALLKNYPETRKLFSKNSKRKKEESDDEELSSEDSEEEPDMKRVKIQDYGKELAEKHEAYRAYRNKTIGKWYDKTRIKHTESNSHTIIDQINHILMDKPKLLKKSQLKRTNYRIIGETEEEEYNTNIYDDEDFYHQQLRELVEFKSADITDPLQLSRQWVQLQNIRSKMKRKIDTRATKGRKLRFGVHTKLVNLAAQESRNSKTEEAKNELLRSIFQKGQ